MALPEFLTDEQMAAIEGRGALTSTPQLDNTGNRVAGQLMQGATFGFGDELEAGLAALEGKFGGFLRGRDTPSMGEMYDRRLGQVRDQNKDFQKENPNAALALQLMGGLPTMALVPGGAGIRGAMKAGAAGGALYGFGSGEGDLTNRTINSVVGAGAGAAGGALLGGAVNLAGKGLQSELGQRIIQDQRGAVFGSNGLKIPELSAEQAAVLEMSKDVSAANISKGIDELKKALANGQDLLPAEAMQSPRLIAETQGVYVNPAGREIGGLALDARDKASRTRLANALRQIGPERSTYEGAAEFTSGINKFINDIKDAQGEQASPLYKAARQEAPLIKDNELIKFIDQSPDAQAAIRDVRRFPHYKVDGETIKTKSLKDNSFIMLDEVKKSIDDSANEAYRAGKHTLANRLNDVAKFIRERVDTYTPKYKEARGASQAYFETLKRVAGDKESRGLLTDILDVKADDLPLVGKRLMEKQPEEIDAIKWMLAPKYKEQFNAGVRSYIQGELEKSTTDSGFSAFRKLVRSDVGRNKLKAALGDEPYAKFADFLDREQKIFEGTKAIRGGSDTIPKAEIQKRQASVVARGLKLLKGLGSGDPDKALTAFDESMPRADDEMIKSIASLLYGKPETTIPAWEQIAQYREIRDPHIKAIAEKLIKPGTKYSGRLGAQSYSGLRRNFED